MFFRQKKFRFLSPVPENDSNQSLNKWNYIVGKSVFYLPFRRRHAGQDQKERHKPKRQAMAWVPVPPSPPDYIPQVKVAGFLKKVCIPALVRVRILQLSDNCRRVSQKIQSMRIDALGMKSPRAKPIEHSGGFPPTLGQIHHHFSSHSQTHGHR